MIGLRLMFAAFLALALGFCLDRAAAAAAHYDVYVLTIGSTNYAEPVGADVHGFSRIDGANESARLVADRLRRGGARFSMVLTSTEETYIGLKDIGAALDRVTAQIARDRPAHPLLVVYFTGHGMAEGFGWSHYSVPGDMVYHGDPDRLGTQDLTGYTLHAASFADRLGKLHHPYLLILDTCSEGKPARFDSPVLTGVASHNLGTLADALRAVNALRQPDPVIFSAPPGEVALTAVNPVDPHGDRIGPMARRLMILLDAALKKHVRVTLTGLVSGLTSSNLDAATRPGVTHAILGPAAAAVVVDARGTPGTLVTRLAMTSQPHVCCTVPTPESAHAAAMTGVLTFKSAPGEFITNGRSFSLLSRDVPLVLEQSDESYLITAGRNPDTWRVEFTPPEGQRLAVGVYKGAQRDQFQSPGHPGLAVSTLTSGCNSVSGSFTITRLHRDASGHVDGLDGSVRQKCDDIPVVLTVDLALSRAAATHARAVAPR